MRKCTLSTSITPGLRRVVSHLIITRLRISKVVLHQATMNGCLLGTEVRDQEVLQDSPARLTMV